MRFKLILLAAAIAPFALALRAPGQTPPAVTRALAPAPVTQPPERSVIGTLDAFDPKTMQIIVGTAAGKQTLHLQAGVTIRQGSKIVKASELPAHKGERVKVRYRETGGVQQAEWIVLAAPPARHPKAPPAKT